MRILFFTDTHGNERYMNEIVEKSHNADIIVCPGDFTIFENDLNYILKRLNSLCKPVIVIHGNHESASKLEAISLQYKNIHFIHGIYYIVDDIIFFGYGGGGFSIVDNKFDIIAYNFIKELNKLEKKNNISYRLILITHAPPYDTIIDNMGGLKTPMHVGCKNFTEFIRKQQPLLAVSGHIHETFELEDKIGKTIIFNPGPRGRIIEL